MQEYKEVEGAKTELDRLSLVSLLL
jgi:hypothetical protein